MAEFRSNDPFRPLLSLADQKSISITEKLFDKKTRMAESPVLKEQAELDAARARLRDSTTTDSSNLIDIAQSSAFQGAKLAYDFGKGFFSDDVSRSTEQIRQEADASTGTTQEARERFVGQPVQEVMDSTAKASLALDQDNYLEAAKQGLIAAGQGVLAAPGVLADSFSAAPEIAAGVVATAAGGGAGIPLLAKKAKSAKNIFKRFEAGVKASKTKLTRGELLKEGLATLPKTAAQMSVVTSTMTQRVIADWEAENKEKASISRKAAFFAANLATMTGQGVILKNLFIPNFKKEFQKEAIAAVSHIKDTSHLRHLGKTVAEGLKKAFVAGGAEGGQEYAQSWVEIISVGIGKNDAFLDGLTRELADADNQVEAAGSAFLGFGAGGVARAVISAPAVAAVGALDATKATVKGTAKTAAGTANLAAKGLTAIADQASFKLLSEEEQSIVSSQHAADKVVAEKSILKFEAAAFKVKAAKSVEDLRRDEGVSKAADALMDELSLNEKDLEDPKVFNKFRHKLAAKFNALADITGAKLQASTLKSIAERTAKNVKAKTVVAANKVIAAVNPTIEKARQAAKDLSTEAKQAVEELRSSSARGMIEMAAKASKKEAKAIVVAARALTMDDLKRTTNVINEINPEIGKQLEQVVRAKEKTLKRVGLKVDDIINDKTLDPIITDVAKGVKLVANEAAALTQALNKTVASTIENLVALKDTETALDVLEKSEDFKKQINGAMSRENLTEVKRKLKVARIRLEKDTRPLKDAVIKDIKDVAAATGPAVKAGVKAVVPAVKKAVNAGVESVKDAVATKIEVTDKFREQIHFVGRVLTSETETKDIMDAETIAGFVKKMRANGIKTNKQFVAFLKKFPELQNSVAFVEELQEEFPGPLVATDIYDLFKTKGMDALKSIQQAFVELNKLNPDCGVK
jgi:hypothetical protein